MTKNMEKVTFDDNCQSTKPRVVTIIYNGLCTFEFGIVTEVFGLNRTELGGLLYRYSTVALEKQPVQAAGGILVQATGTREQLSQADIVVIPGWRGSDEPVPTTITTAIKAAHNRGARLLSICSGAYVLAAAGILNQRRVTTHWRYAEDFSKKFPDTVVEVNSLYTDDKDIITSAGSSAGIDACLHIVRSDHGAKIANSVARRLVMHAHRHGGQAQFIEQPFPEREFNYSISELMDYVRSKIAESHTIATMSKTVNMSPRTFQRNFVALTGVPVKEWINRERVIRSCQLLESTELGVEDICSSVGFSNAETLRYHFRKQLAISPIAYRKRFTTTNIRMDRSQN